MSDDAVQPAGTPPGTYAAPATVGSILTLAIIDPQGKRKVLGRIFRHRNRLLNATIGTLCRWQLEFNTKRHNARYPVTSTPTQEA